MLGALACCCDNESGAGAALLTPLLSRARAELATLAARLAALATAADRADADEEARLAAAEQLQSLFEARSARRGSPLWLHAASSQERFYA